MRIYSHTDQDSPSVFSMQKAIEDTVSIVEPIYRKRGVSIIKRLDCPIPNIQANMGKFHQVLMNLLSNACDAMETKETRIIQITTKQGGDGGQVIISDTGEGMVPETRERIFDTFFTTKPTGKGTGLGLSISSTLVTEMKGRIQVDSTPGKGTTFTLTFPLSAR